MFLRTVSISHWKLAGQPSRPIGEVIQWYWPLPGIMNAVSGCESSSNCICQKPDVRSSVEKNVELALPMSPIHSVISFILYLSMCEWLFNSLKSCTMRKPWPCFLGTQKSGELYRELDRLTTPNFNHSSRVVSIKFWWASGILNCLRYTGLLSLRCILCVKFFAHPKSILFMLMAAWCLCKISTYFCFSSCGTFKFAFCSISAREKCFFCNLGNFSSMFEMIDATVFSLRGRHCSASNSSTPRI